MPPVRVYRFHPRRIPLMKPARRGDRYAMLAQRYELTPKEAAHDNRRRHGRVRVAGVLASIGEVIDISASGMKLRSRTATGLRIGGLCTFSMATPEGVLAVDVLVMWTKRVGWRQSEIGVQFVNITEDAWVGIRSVMRGCMSE